MIGSAHKLNQHIKNHVDLQSGTCWSKIGNGDAVKLVGNADIDKIVQAIFDGSSVENQVANEGESR